MRKKITNPKELELGKFYKSENNEYFKVTGFDSVLGTSGVLFMWDKKSQDYGSTPSGEWIDAVVEEGVYEISKKKFYKAFKKFYKKHTQSLLWELNNLEVVRRELLAPSVREDIEELKSTLKNILHRIAMSSVSETKEISRMETLLNLIHTDTVRQAETPKEDRYLSKKN